MSARSWNPEDGWPMPPADRVHIPPIRAEVISEVVTALREHNNPPGRAYQWAADFIEHEFGSTDA